MFADVALVGGRVLDLGCGAGFDAPGLSSRGFRLVGLDISHALLVAAQATEAFAGHVVQGDMLLLPFASHSFEGAWASGSLHHLEKAHLPSTLREVWRVLTLGGALFLSVERGTGEGLAYPDADVTGARYYAHYEPDELASFIRDAGFDVVRVIAGESNERSGGFIALTALRR